MSRYAFTSQETLEKIADHCPSAMGTYLHCVNKMDDENNVFFSRTEIETDRSLSLTVFKNNLKKLARENLLEWHFIDNGIFVTLAAEDYDEDSD